MLKIIVSDLEPPLKRKKIESSQSSQSSLTDLRKLFEDSQEYYICENYRKIDRIRVNYLNREGTLPASPFIVGKNNYRLLIFGEQDDVSQCLLIPRKINGFCLPSENNQDTVILYETCAKEISTDFQSLFPNENEKNATNYFIEIWELFSSCPVVNN